MPGEHSRRPDASMTLLAEVMQRPLDPGYAAAAERRAHGWRPRRRTRALVAGMAAVCALLTTWSVVELRRPTPEVVAARRALEAEIERRVEAADRLRESNTRVRQQIAAARQQALGGAGAADVETRVTTLAQLAGETALAGPGLRVELTDARADADATNGQVLDRDIQVVVNALWAAGAEAIDVNGYRLTTTSAIRRAGEAVLVDLQPVLPPYRVRAIGEPSAMPERFGAGVGGAYLDVLRRDGIQVQVTTSSMLRVPAAGDTVDLIHAQPVGPEVEAPALEVMQ